MSVEATATSRGRAQTPRRRAASGGSHARRWLLAVCCVAQFMVILDLSIVNVALPSIQSSLGFSSPELQWVVDAYAITFAGFLMLGGRAADHFGQRRTFVAGAARCSRSPRWPAASRRTADVLVGRARGAGPRRRADGGVLAGDHHLVVRARARSSIARSARGRR